MDSACQTEASDRSSTSANGWKIRIYTLSSERLLVFCFFFPPRPFYSLFCALLFPEYHSKHLCDVKCHSLLTNRFMSSIKRVFVKCTLCEWSYGARTVMRKERMKLAIKAQIKRTQRGTHDANRTRRTPWFGFRYSPEFWWGLCGVKC